MPSSVRLRIPTAANAAIEKSCSWRWVKCEFHRPGRSRLSFHRPTIESTTSRIPVLGCVARWGTGAWRSRCQASHSFRFQIVARLPPPPMPGCWRWSPRMIPCSLGALPTRSAPNCLLANWPYWLIWSIDTSTDARHWAGGRGGTGRDVLHFPRSAALCETGPSLDPAWTRASAIHIRCNGLRARGPSWARYPLPRRPSEWRRSVRTEACPRPSADRELNGSRGRTNWTHETFLLHPWCCLLCSWLAWVCALVVDCVKELKLKLNLKLICAAARLIATGPPLWVLPHQAYRVLLPFEVAAEAMQCCLLIYQTRLVCVVCGVCFCFIDFLASLSLVSRGGDESRKVVLLPRPHGTPENDDMNRPNRWSRTGEGRELDERPTLGSWWAHWTRSRTSCIPLRHAM